MTNSSNNVSTSFDKVKARLESCNNLPTPPRVAAQIIQLGQDLNADIGDIARVVSQDPALTAKLLKLANTPYYSRSRKTENLRQAVSLFGINGTLTLALSFSLVRNLSSRDALGLDYQHYWCRCLTTAIAASRICESFRRSARDQCFIAGLLHDIGVLAIDKAMPEVYREIGEAQYTHTSMARYEVQRLTCDHATVGAWLLENWNMPEFVVKSASHSHDLKPPEDLLVASVVAASELAEIVWGVGVSDVRRMRQIAEYFPEIRQSDMSELALEIGPQIKDMASIFNIELGDEESLDILLEKAADALTIRSMENLKETSVLNEQAETLRAESEALRSIADHDALTGLYSRRYFDTTYPQEFAAAKQHGWPLALLFVDLDHFKDINDKHGHLVGDRLLRAAADLLRRDTRSTDIPCRFGGEEFVVVLPGSGSESAAIVCERILQSFRGASIDVDGRSIGVLASIGVAIQGEGKHGFECHKDLIRAADAALYAAKSQGRDRFQIYQSDPSSATS